jgi:hypothetical protein
MSETACAVCGGALWVCEDHMDKPWGGASTRADACRCGGAGAPCPACNPCDEHTLPRLPDDYESFRSRYDWGRRKSYSVAISEAHDGHHARFQA